MFLKTLMNWIDFITIIPYFVQVTHPVELVSTFTSEISDHYFYQNTMVAWKLIERK